MNSTKDPKLTWIFQWGGFRDWKLMSEMAEPSEGVLKILLIPTKTSLEIYSCCFTDS